jgi:hypothetical protein
MDVYKVSNGDYKGRSAALPKEYHFVVCGELSTFHAIHSKDLHTLNILSITLLRPWQDFLNIIGKTNYHENEN